MQQKFGIIYHSIKNVTFSGINFYESANDACKNLDAELVEFDNDNEVKAFISLLKAGNFCIMEKLQYLKILL